MRTQTKATLAVAVVVVLAVAGFFVLASGGEKKEPVKEVDTALEDTALIRSDSHVLGEKGSTGVTFVEFIDYECPGCGALAPLLEQIREDYAGRVTFVVRQFPLDMHPNAEPAARAVEAAALQGKFTQMHDLVFASQAEWGGREKPADDLLRGYAEQLGLDMDQFDRDVESAAVKERIARDRADGHELQVPGTPTLYVDGKLLEPENVGDITAALDAALEKR